MYFISYLLRFSDRIDRMKNSNQSRESTFSHVGKAVSSNQKSAVRMNQSVCKRINVVFGASSIFTHRNLYSFYKFTQVFSKICHKPQQSSNRFIALDKPIKKYIQEEQSKKTRTKTRWDARLACLGHPNKMFRFPSPSLS